MPAPCKIELVAQAMGLIPSSKKQNELRYGAKGSLLLNLVDDCFFDFEAQIGGGVFQFVIHKGYANNERDAVQYLEDHGLISDFSTAANRSNTELRHHIYVDERSKWLRKAAKFTNGQWAQFRWENEQWKPKVTGVRNVPYGLDRLRDDNNDELCFVFEGEKDVERAWHNGLIATCNVGGAGKWANDLNQYLVGRTVCIVPDNDEAGSNHAQKVQASLHSSGIDCFILWDYRDGLDVKGDFSDWMDANHDDLKKFKSLAESAAKAPRQVEKPPEFEAMPSVSLSNKKPTEDELADIVLQALDERNLITNYSGTMHWDGQRWLCLGDEMLRELVRSRLRALSIPIRRSLLVNVSNLIKDRTFNLNKRFNISKDHIVSVLNGDLLYLDGKWTLTPPERDRMRTTLLPHQYDPDATAPGFLQFLDDIFDGDPDAHEKSSLVLQHMGYGLQTHTNLERFAIYVGTGGNGKSILLNTLKELVGIENVAAVQPHMLKSSFHRASLNNKLANIITESDQGGKLPAAEIKALVSGEAMTVDHKFGHPFVMEPFATLFWATNHLPYPHDYSDALYRRVDIVEFNRKFEGQDRNLNLRHELREEMSGILNAALEAYAAVIRHDFEEPISVSKAKAKWRKNSNPVACWAEERLQRSMLAELQSKLAYEDFNEWCDENGHKLTLTQTTFSERLKLLGHEKVRKNKAVFWRDVQLVK
ncbi:MAG: hypothetical protein HOL77_09920 [Rhodobacteraceae bacterium]|jgi:putative DNA primase/helicase|nr:hypothetical protein [Paracoccaceae bacterium]